MYHSGVLMTAHRECIDFDLLATPAVHTGTGTRRMASKKPPEISAEIRQVISEWLAADPAGREPGSERRLARSLGVHRSLIWYLKREYKRPEQSIPPLPSPWSGSPLATNHARPLAPKTGAGGDGRFPFSGLSIYTKPRTFQEWETLRRRGGRRVLFSVKIS